MSTLENGAVETISSDIPAPECTEIRGCAVKDNDEEATVTSSAKCPVETVTDVVVTCTGTGTEACSTKTSTVKTGCSATASTTTLPCSSAPSGKAKRQEEGDGSGESCGSMKQYTIFPRDGMNLDEAKATWEQMVEVIGDESRIENLQDRPSSVDFWYATLREDEAQALREIPTVSFLARDEESGSYFLTSNGEQWMRGDN